VAILGTGHLPASVEQAAEQVDRFITMVTLGSPREQLAAEGHGWVVTETKVQRQLLRRRRGVEVAVLDRREEPLVHPVSPGSTPPWNCLRHWIGARLRRPSQIAAVGMVPASLETGYGLSTTADARLGAMVDLALDVLAGWEARNHA
jgi:hypothetical protein